MEVFHNFFKPESVALAGLFPFWYNIIFFTVCMRQMEWSVAMCNCDSYLMTRWLVNQNICIMQIYFLCMYLFLKFPCMQNITEYISNVFGKVLTIMFVLSLWLKRKWAVTHGKSSLCFDWKFQYAGRVTNGEMDNQSWILQLQF